ncbi:uncharacterized protein CIMG_13698 [Coccidioides immitis RS]|uniref:Uncharacterized protein n=1 Tax=Coccidioides immitis (strain RS) TaxID=246410 RepID=A0A0E1RWN0_COCIM|nr:uncharacterized protein CIMG_13698 [Coccidioides immitis RS]EAS32260.1 hypothetical protein CIMG_13698 [Coccidioides immitis RS]
MATVMPWIDASRGTRSEDVCSSATSMTTDSRSLVGGARDRLCVGSLSNTHRRLSSPFEARR